jgi:eukaryotic-like serine/threonine-protein kinase
VHLALGTFLGPYEVVSPLGAGGMGEVYRARDTRLNRDVAIKILPGVFAHDPDRLARFEREAQVLASLNHPNIAHVYGLEESDGARAIVMEYVDGPTLAEVIADRPQALAPDAALPLARQIAEALEAAHGLGIIHRDLKPANIKVRPDGTVKVLDFGLAKLQAGGSGEAGRASGHQVPNTPTITSPAMTRAGVLLGTAPYMSPEQARGAPVDKRSDIWAFGCVLFEMLSGRRAFAGDSITDVLASVVKDTPDWSALPGATPASVRRLLARCLEKEPRRRLHDIADARIEIEEAIDSPVESASTRGSQTMPRARHREQIAWAAAAALGLLATSLAAVLVMRPAASPAPQQRVSIVHRSDGAFPGAPQISPDGRRVVYSAEGKDGLFRLWVRGIDAFEPRVLEGTESIPPFHHPFWSPDSRSIGFFADGKLKRVSADGGGVQAIADTVLAVGGAWSAQGVILYGPHDSSGLLRIPADGGTPEPVTTLPTDAPWSHMWPAFLPDGRRFLFTARAWNRAFDTSEAGIFLGSLDEPGGRRLLPDVSSAIYVDPGYILFARDGVLTAVPFDAGAGRTTGDAIPLAERVTLDSVNRMAAFSVSRAGLIALRQAVPFEDQLQARWLDRRGNEIGVLGDALPGSSGAHMTPDGRLVALAIADVRTANSDIWIADANDGNPRRLTSSTEWEGHPRWSQDGTRIAYVSTSQTGAISLNVQDLQGGEPIVLLESGSTQFVTPWSWSPDGAYLLYSRAESASGQTDLYTWSFASQSATPYVATPAFDSGGIFSPDGRWVAYVSAGETWVARFPKPEERRRIATDAFPISWRNDGREILVMPPWQDVVAIPLTMGPAGIVAGAPTVLVKGPTDFGPRIMATADHSRFLVGMRPDPERGVREIHLVSGLIDALREGRLGGR